MSRVKPLILVGLLLGVSALSISLTPAQEDSDLAALEARVKALETRLGNLEKSFAQRVAALERQATVLQSARQPSCDSQHVPGLHRLPLRLQQVCLGQQL